MSTLRDIAEKAQVDVSIVSRILHKRDFRRASAATREKIELAAKELGYEANGLARSLVRQKTDMVGLMVPDLYEPAFIRYLETIDELLELQGMQVLPLLSRWSAEREAKLLRVVRQRRVDGLISLFYNQENHHQYEELCRMGVPIVFRKVDNLATPSFDNVQVDIAQGAYVLTKHLWENGFSRVAILGGFAAHEISQNNTLHGVAEGYARAHHEAGRPVDPVLAIQCRDDGADAADRIDEYLTRHPGGFDGVLVQSNSKLPGLYRAFTAHGLRIGTDVGVTTITDSEFCHLGRVAITAWEQPVQEICEALVGAFLHRLKNPEDRATSVSYSSRLIVRESSSRRSS